MALTPGDTFGRYRIDGHLGEGGMGTVYLAQDVPIGRPVALKVISAQLARDEEFRRRFVREARIAATLEHPHVVPVYEIGEQDGLLFIAMRRVPGRDLRSLVVELGALPPQRVAHLARQVGAALDAAHAAGLVHRDVKPANVLLTGEAEDEHAYLTDFGLSRDVSSDSGLTNTGQWMGTVDYVAPEQLRGEPIDARSDVYAMGCLLFECLTGRVPYVGVLAAKLHQHASAPPPSATAVRPDLPAEVDAVLARALAKDPNDRYKSAGDLGRALDAALLGRAMPIVDRTVATGAALAGIPPGASAAATEPGGRPEPPTEPNLVQEVGPDDTIPAKVAAPEPAAAPATPREPRPPRTFLGPPASAPSPIPAAARDGSGRTVALALTALALVAAGVGGAIALSGGSEEPGPSATVASDTGASTGERTVTVTTPAGTATAEPTAQPTATATPSSPVSEPSYEHFAAPSGLFVTEVPTGDGWRVVGETEVNPRLRRTVLRGPGGETIWIDATPDDVPQFGTRDRRVISDRRVGQPTYGTQREVVFDGDPPFCQGRCVDYQVTIGDGGLAVLGGGGDVRLARAVARHIADALQAQF